jgi:hypothetical protein
MPSLFLTVEDMVVLTGRRSFKLQIEALSAMGVPFLINALGRAVVTRAAVEARVLASAPTAASLSPAAPVPTTRAYLKGMRAPPRQPGVLLLGHRREAAARDQARDRLRQSR